MTTLTGQVPATVLGVTLATALVAPAAFAVDDLGLFELDGNAEQDGAPPPDDWEELFTSGGSANVFTGVTADPAPMTIFTGGRKDIQDIDQWRHKNGAVPDKSDITNAYAASYEDNGDLIVYFGADRVANAGDTFLGFWFFKSSVTLKNDGSFDGLHQPGDTLVLVNFPQAANAVPLIQVVEWDPTCSKADSSNPQVDDCAAANLRLRAGVAGAGAICSPGLPGEQPACAITNEENGANDPTPSPWPYMSKDGFVDEFPFETFFEGGINLTELISGDACFSSFMAETRSSSSFTASLKDFVLDAFPVCSISVAKACTNPRLNAAEDMIVYDITGEVSNDGSGTVYNVAVVDSPPFDPGSLQFVDCLDPTLPQDPATLGGGESICYAATITVPLAQNGTKDTVTASANTAADGSGTELPATAEATCPVLQVSPALSVDKLCSSAITVSGGLVVAEVNVSGEVCNVGDSRIDNVLVDDDKAGVLLSGVSLVAPADPNDPGSTPGACQTYMGSYFPDEANDSDGVPTSDPGAVVFKDTVTASGTDIFGTPVTPQQVMATCPLCP